MKKIFDLWDINDEPVFEVRLVGDKILTDGVTSYSSGHKIENGKHGKLDGVYAEWTWDGRKLTVRNDRYGCHPLYYYEGNKRLAISPSLFKLLDRVADRSLNNEALAVFLRLGFMIGEDTPFNTIKAVPPDVEMNWEQGDLQVSGKWIFKRPQQISRDEAIDGFISLFKKAIQHRRPDSDNFVVLLSGGLDSRHILLELTEQGFIPTFCLTATYFAPFRRDDIKIATEICKQLRLSHVVLDQCNSPLEAQLKTKVLTDLCADEHDWFIAVADYLKDRCDIVYDGFAGGNLSSGYRMTTERLRFFQSGRYFDLADNMLGRERRLKSFLPASVYKRFNRQLAIRHLAKELERHDNAANPLGSFRFWNKSRREIALSPYKILRDVTKVYAPYLDHELFDYLSSIPANIFLEKPFHEDTIRRAYPQLNNVPFASKGSPKEHNYKEYQRLTSEMIRYVVRNLPADFVRHSHLLPRLGRCLFDRAYRPAISWISSVVTYLILLEKAEKWHK